MYSDFFALRVDYIVIWGLVNENNVEFIINRISIDLDNLFGFF